MVERRTVTLGVMLLAAAASGWWLYGLDATAPVTGESVVADFDYFLADFELVEMDPDGALKHTLVAENLYHYPDLAQSTLAQPQLMFYEDARMAWEISADQGLIHESDRSVYLSGGVHIQYTAAGEGRDFEIHTDRLRVWPDDQRAETDDRVKIVQQFGVTWSTGMTAEFELRQVYLLSDVSGRYEP